MTHRGTTNRNQRGGTEARRRRREWLVETYRADRSVVYIWFRESDYESPLVTEAMGDGAGKVRLQQQWGRAAVSVPACRCYRCGHLLTVETVTVDRIIPGCKGGTYKRNNIRPACGRCNSQTGATLRAPSR